MAANKFATMLHRKSNKFTLILVYAMLEWILILLLLLNSLFSYLIIKFADYFGLKRPCLFCSRLDHVFEPAKFQNSYRSLVCEAHGMELSKLGYCSNHRKLAESQDMCEGCSSSHNGELPNKFAFFPWIKKLGVIRDCSGEKISDNGEAISKCSCCGVKLEMKFWFPDDYLMKPFWGDSENTHKGNLVWEVEFDDKIDGDYSDRKESGFVCDRCGEEQRTDKNRGTEDENRDDKKEEDFSWFLSSFDCKELAADESGKVDLVMEKEKEFINQGDLNASMDDPSCDKVETVQADCNKNMSSEIQPQHLEFYIDQDDCHLIPIELVCSSPIEKQIRDGNDEEEEENCGNEDFVLEFDKHVGSLYDLVVEETSTFEEKVPLLPIQESEEEETMADELDPMEFNENESFSEVLEDYELLKEEFEQITITELAQSSTNTSNGDDVQDCSAVEEMEFDNNNNVSEGVQMLTDDIEADVSIGTEIPDNEPIENFQIQEVCSPSLCIIEDPSNSYADYHACDDHGCKQDEEEGLEFRTIDIETSELIISPHLSSCSERNGTDEDKIPDTSTSLDRLHHLHTNLLFLERVETSTEESLDESVGSDTGAGDGVLMVEKLKSALRAEKKALSAVYAELEEERSASAVAANETMAMINRLQEEKAAMQMEAFQYHRMMEEQSEYDQEALQLLNELMVKREKEKAELEKELELYRKKVQDYEAKEKYMILKRMKESSTRSGTSSAYCSNAEDSDGLSVDMNHEGKEEDSFDNHLETSNQNTPVDAILYLEESMTGFDEERLSILEQLKVLEEKLFALSDEKEHFKDIKSIEHLYQENGNRYNEDLDHCSEANGVANGHYKEMNGKSHQERKNIGAKAKRLLPLFDATDSETDDGILNGHAGGVGSVVLLKSIDKFDIIDSKKLEIEEEMDYVYERLQALEADREFFKHSITSLRKGDKGIELLQEILHHLRDLRNMELRLRNMEDGAL